MNGTELAVRFSYIVNSLRYCGPAEAHKRFRHYLKNKDNKEEVDKLLTKFEALMPYLDAIAQKTGKKPFDYDVVEAYWIGNELLDKLGKKDLEKIINELVRNGLPIKMGERLIQKLPDGFVPLHAFNVFYVGVGQTTRKVPTTLPNMNKCMTSYGRVKKIEEKELMIVKSFVELEDNRYFFGKEKEQKVMYMKEMIPEVKVDDIVALHWNFATVVLDDRQLENLKKYTQKVLDAMNSI